MRRPSVFLAPPGTGGKRRADYFILTRLISLRAPGKLSLMRAVEGKLKGLSGSSRQLNMLNFDILFLKERNYISALFIILLLILSVYKELHALKRDNFFIFCVILNQRASSTLSSSALKMKKFFFLELSRVRRHKICVMQDALNDMYRAYMESTQRSRTQILCLLTVFLVN